MPKLPWHPASGTGLTYKIARKVIRFVRYGCANRPFYHIVVIEGRKEQRQPPIEQLGTYDPIANVHNEKLVSLNYERIQYWLAKGAHLSIPVAELLGICGFYPIHPRSYMTAWRNREASDLATAAAAAAAAAAEAKEQETVAAAESK